MFLPVNIAETEIQGVMITGDGEDAEVSIVPVQGYEYDEYRINKAEGLPDEAVSALAEAFHIENQALQILGVI